MLPLLLVPLLVLSLPADPPDREDCIDRLPVQSDSDLPISTFSEAERFWTTEDPVPRDTLRRHLARLRDARRCFQSLPSEEAKRPYRDVTICYRWAAYLHAGLRQFSQADDALLDALSHLEKPLLPPDSARSVRERIEPPLHEHRGYLHFLSGDLATSLHSYLRAYEATPASNPSQRVQYLIDIGILHQRTQDYRSARHFYRRAARTFDRTPLTASSHSSQKARLLSVQAYSLLEETLNTDYDRRAIRRARRLAQRARAFTEPGTERHARTTMALSESLGYLDQLDRAYRLNATVRRHARAKADQDLLAYTLLKRGLLHVQSGRWTAADSILNRTLQLSRRLGKLDYQRRALRALGRLHEMQAEWESAEQYYRDGVAVVEQYRSSLTASEWSTTAFAQWRDVYRGLTRSLLAQDRDSAAFAALDRSRARHLRDLRTQARLTDRLSPVRRARYDSLTRALTQVRGRLGRGAPPSLADSLRARESLLMAARQEALPTVPSSSFPSVDVLSEILDRRDRALVSYFIDNPWPVYDRSPRSVAFVLTPDSLRTVPLPHLTQDSVRRHVEAVSPLFTDWDPERANAMHFDLRPLHHLYEAIYAPVARHLRADRPLTIVPDGPLYRLPFSMLVESLPGGRFAPSEARFLLHERPTSLEIAASLVADTSRGPSNRSRFTPQVAAYGVSQFDTLGTVPSALHAALPEAAIDSSFAPSPLPGVERELRALASTVADTRIALNRTATEQSLRHDVRTAGILHLASHAFVHPSSPLQNALLLHPDSSETDPSNGVLFLHELHEHRSRIPLVVLSGCGTANGPLRGGEGMEGLQYAFRAMGARSTLSTLWPVSDAASVDLMRSFYRHLEEGLSKDRALQQAKLQYLTDHPQRSSPFFWAPPILYGTTTSLPLEPAWGMTSWGWAALGLSGVLLAGLLFWWRRERLPGPFCHLGLR